MENIKRVVLYLSGSYPGLHLISDRLRVLFAIRRADPSSDFNDTVVNQLYNKTDGEYYNSLLSHFLKKNGEDMYNSLLDELEVPQEVREKRVNTSTGKGKKQSEDETMKFSAFIHTSIKAKFAKGIREKLYDGAFVEAFNVLNDRLCKYCNEALGAGECKEMDAINAIFEQHAEDNTFKMKRNNDTQKGMENGLKGLFEGLIKFYRNASAHDKDYLTSEKAFIQAMMLLSTLLDKVDNSKIATLEKSKSKRKKK